MIREFAPAKVNLTLRTGKVREDGYHPVDSVVVFADWGDALTAETGDGLSLSISGPQGGAIPADETNLVMRAARMLANAAGVEAAGRLKLVKSIPAGAGLGGGSADAAAALRALNRLWELDWPLEMLAGIGAEIGSDIPACLWSRPLRMTGRGERIRLIDEWPAFTALLVNPGVAVATGKVFQAFDDLPAGTGQGFRLTGGLDRLSVLADLNAATNDLTAPACAVAPVIAGVLAELADEGSAELVRMSGSGATCFAVYADSGARDLAAEKLRARQPGWLVQPVEFPGVPAINPA